MTVLLFVYFALAACVLLWQAAHADRCFGDD